jgi:hypothetical protein
VLAQTGHCHDPGPNNAEWISTAPSTAVRAGLHRKWPWTPIPPLRLMGQFGRSSHSKFGARRTCNWQVDDKALGLVAAQRTKGTQ